MNNKRRRSKHKNVVANTNPIQIVSYGDKDLLPVYDNKIMKQKVPKEQQLVRTYKFYI